VKRGSILAHLKGARVEPAIRLKCPDRFIEQMLAFGMDNYGKVQSEEFFARVSVHPASRGIGFKHLVRLQLVDDQAIAGGIENAAILPFFVFRRW
jgi:hypothetical protein